MVSNVGLNTTAGLALPALAGTEQTNSNSKASIFTNYNSIPTNDYSNDLLMNGINFSQLASALPVQQQAANPQAQPQQTIQAQQSFGSNPQVTEQQPQVNDTQTAEPKKSNWGKIAGAISGFLAPIAPKVVKLFKGGKFADLFKSKELLVSCPIFGVVGLGVGMLLDSCFSSRKVQAQNSQTSQQQQQIIKDFVKQ